MSCPQELPANLPIPDDDGAADHLPGLKMPDIALPSTDGETVRLSQLGAAGHAVLYVYPLTARPGVALPSDWDAIPGARGCTPEACGFRDHHAELRTAGVSQVFGLSSQASDYQREVVGRLHLPFALLSDPVLQLADALRLPTFTADGLTLFRRLTLVIQEGVVERAFYPVFPPDRHAEEVLTWLHAIK